jgi:hypothetical protein
MKFIKFISYLSVIAGMYVVIGGICLSTYNLQLANEHGLVYLPSLALATSVVSVGSSPLLVVGMWKIIMS